MLEAKEKMMNEKELLEKASHIPDEILDLSLAGLYLGAMVSGIPWEMLGLNRMPSQEAITRAAAAMVKE